jgi:glycosyltransferase involved in cell wall biosynthesis
MELIWVEPDIRNVDGHSYNTIKTVKRWMNCNYTFCKIKLLVNSNCNKSIINEFNAIPTFNLPNNKIIFNKLFWFFLGWLYYSIIIYCGTKSYLNKIKSKNILVYFNTCQFYHLIAMMPFLIFNKPGNLKFLFTYRLSVYNSKNKLTYRFYIYFICIKLINLLSNKRYSFITDSELLKNEFEDLYKINCDLICIPHTKNFNKLKHDNSKIIISILGPSRLEKGSLIAAHSIVNLLNNKFPKNTLFIFHIFGQLQQKIMLILNEYQNNENLIIRAQPLTDEKYYNDLFMSDIVLNNYESGTYSKNTSGIFTEAVSSSKIIITTKETWMAQQCKNFNIGVVIENNVEELSNSILKIIENIEFYKDCASAGSVRFNKFHNVENFCESIVRIWNQKI